MTVLWWSFRQASIALVLLAVGIALMTIQKAENHRQGGDPTFVHRTTVAAIPIANGNAKAATHIELYHNLSCPFEWSKYSCFRHGHEERAQAAWDYADFHIRANAAAAEVGEVKSAAPTGFHHPPTSGQQQQQQQRLILVGDSTMRQIFIALGCRLWNDGVVAQVALPWLDHWPCHGTIHCITAGPHSGFNAASLRLTSGAEVHFLPHSGTVPDAQGNNAAEPVIVQRWKRELIPPRSSSNHNSSSSSSSHSSSSDPLRKLTLGPHVAMPSRYSKYLNANDTIVYNVGLHWEEGRTAALQSFASLGKKLLSMPSKARPQLFYMTTITQHFRTASGEHDPSQWKELKELECRSSVAVNRRREEETQILQEAVHVDRLLEYDSVDAGDLHIGGGDCTHYCMPGPPDVAADKLLHIWHDPQPII